MNRLLWVLLNGVLVAVAYAVTLWVLNQVPAGAAVPEADWREKETAQSVSQQRAAARKSRVEDSGDEAGVGADFDVLWRETLFRPDRSEELSAEPSEDEQVEPESFNLELIGLAQVGARSVAVIVEHRAPARRPVRRPARTASRDRSASQLSDEERGPPDRHVYEVDDEVAQSGYTVKEIRLDDNEVVVVRGNEERILTLDKSDEQSSSRLQQAADTAEQAKRAQLAAERSDQATPKNGPDDTDKPPPPPPPPVRGTAGKADTKGADDRTDNTARRTVTEMTREERLERARLLRERILQRRSQNNND